MPSGLLRESAKGAHRADAIVVTKAKEPDSYPELDRLEIPYFQTGIAYGDPIYFFSESKPLVDVVAVAGLANNQAFLEYVSEHYRIQDVFTYGDHHNYTLGDIDQIAGKLKNGTALLTTHKDAVKLKKFESLKNHTCAYLPIRVKFFKEEEHFLQMVEESLKDYPINQ